MDILIILIILYIVTLYLGNKFKQKLTKHKKYYNIGICVSYIPVLFGCLTPINHFYAFCIAYGIVGLNALVFKIMENK